MTLETSLLIFLGTLVFAAGGFYLLIGWRVTRCEQEDADIKKELREIRDNHLWHIEKKLVRICEKLGIEDD